jgi:hypothetical protein
MSYCRVHYVKIEAKIGKPGSAGMLAIVRTPAIGRKSASAGMPTTAETIATAGTSTSNWNWEPAIAGRPATVRTSGTKRTPATAGPQATSMAQQQQ